MRMRCFFLFVLLAVLNGGESFAAKKQKAYATLVSARKAQAPAANGKMNPTTELVIVWNSSTYPESFFWRGENGWLPCRIQKYKKGASVTEANDIENGRVHKGDTLLLIPTSGGKFAIPAEIPETAKNTLYYKTGGGKWLSLKVGKVG